MTLNDIKDGKACKILYFELSEKKVKRLYALGITVGTVVTVIRRAPFFSPIEIKVKDFYLAIRSNDCKKIIVGQL